MKQLFLCILTFFLYISCSGNRTASVTGHGYPDIFPDYKEVSIPVNIAPLNFKVEKASYIKASFSCNEQLLFEIDGDNTIDIPLKKWQHLLSEYSGKQIDIAVSVWDKPHPEGIRYKSFPIYITPDSIDPYIAYRLIEPGYESWHEMDIRQRSLNSFNEEIIISSNMNEKGCVNCHSFCDYSPTDFMFHARTSPGGTIVVKDNQATKIQLSQIGSSKEGTYPHWHPSGNYIIFSTNTTRQSFYSRNPDLIEVYDLESDLVLYDIAHNTVISDPRFSGPTSFETFPAWAPDGKRLYYCCAPAKQLPKELKELRYSICSVSFDPESGTFGETVDTVYKATGKSASFPRISPDNRYLLYTESDYATFPIWHKEADLKMISLQDSSAVDTEILNSPDVESYHSWSSNGRWIIFSSRRLDGLYTRFFIAHFDTNGTFSKPFLLPQKDPEENSLRLKSFNIPEFIKGKVTITRSRLDHTVTD